MEKAEPQWPRRVGPGSLRWSPSVVSIVDAYTADSSVYLTAGFDCGKPMPSRCASSCTHRRCCRAIASRLAHRTSGLVGLDTSHRRECFPNATYGRVAATVLAALDTTRFRQL